MSLMNRALTRGIAGPAANGVNAAAVGGPATRALPAGQTGVGLDAAAAARAEALQKFQAMRASGARLAVQMGQDAYEAALEELHAKAIAADAAYRRAAEGAGRGMFTE